MIDEISTDMVLNVLSLEDSVPDFEIIRGQLINAGYALNISRVDKESEFESSLRSNTYDIILADFKLPGFDAFAALRLHNEICPDIPFICVSGTIGEETAIELIKQGAVDYVLKDRLERLPFAINRALDEARERETQRQTWEALQESERKLREAQEMAHLGFWQWDVTTGDVEWSEEVFKIFGLDPKEFTPRIESIQALSPWAEDHQRDKELINRALETHSPGNYEQKFLRPDQSIGYYYSTFQGNYNEKGDLISIIGTVLDITEQKQSEELLHARMRLMEYAARHSLNELLQMTLDEIGTLTNSPIGFYHFVEKDQKTLSLQAWSTRTLDTFCTAQGNGLHYSLDKAGVWVDCVRQHGPVVHNDYASLSHRKGMPEGHAAVVRELVVPIMREDTIVAILGVGNKPSDYTEKDIQIVSYLADVAWEIAERKRAEELLNKSEEKYRGIFENSIEGIYQSTPEGRYLKVNPAFARMFGYDSPDEMIGQITDIEKQLYVNPGDREKLKKSLTDHGYVEGIDVEAYRKDGTTFWTSITSRAVKDKTGATLYFEGMNMDITERKLADEELKRAHRDLEKNQVAMLNLLEDLNEENKTRKRTEEELRENEDKFRYVFESANVGKSITLPTGEITVNKALCNIIGYTQEELREKTWQDITHPDDIEDTQKMVNLLLNGDTDGTRFNKRYIHKNGSSVWADISSAIRRDREGKPLHFITTVVDITERKKAEDALTRYASRLESLRDLDLEILKVSAPENIADIAVTHISKAINCTRVSVIVFNLDRNIGTILALSSKITTKLVRGAVIPLDDLNFSPDMASGSLFAANDLQEEHLSGVRKQLKKEGIRSLLNIPLIVEGKLLGSLNLADEAPHTFSTENQDIAIEVARVLAIGLRQSDLRKRIEKHLGELEAEISRRAATEAKLRSALEEREVLLREVHHRVKNNLQAMIFLMQMQREKISDAPLAGILHDLEGKARTMSLIYEQLFQSENLAHIDMEHYLTALIINNLQSLRERSDIAPHISVSSVVMDVETAMPIGLIVNELVTNVLKYAFPVSFTGIKELTVTLREEKECYILTVSDNGIGLPPGTDPANTSTMGLKLVYLWVTHQLDGTITIDNKKGAAYIIAIPRKLSRSVPHA